jgi:hypothetical protein
MKIEYHDIKAEELRIGNFFYPDVDGDAYAKITAKDILELYSDPLDDYYKSLPLTEDWLVKFGFEEYIDFGYKTGNFDKVPLCGFTYSINTNKVMIMHKGNNISHWLDIKIKYVHQLQNLYFSLTNQELEVKNV